jgi:hypothetical protein
MLLTPPRLQDCDQSPRACDTNGDKCVRLCMPWGSGAHSSFGCLSPCLQSVADAIDHSINPPSFPHRNHKPFNVLDAYISEVTDQIARAPILT